MYIIEFLIESIYKNLFKKINKRKKCKVMWTHVFMLLIPIWILCIYFNIPSHAQEIYPSKHKSNTYIIAQDGSGDFTYIQDGVNYASDGDTLIIKEGFYDEFVEIFDKEINLIGTDKDKCILKYNSSKYWRVPLMMASGTISNITIYAYNSTEEPYRLTDEEIVERYRDDEAWNRVNSVGGYAVHIEQDFLFGKKVKFENCVIISETNSCVGIGGRGNCDIVFEKCVLVSLGQGSCVFMHDSALPEYGGKMNFVMKDCYLTSLLNPRLMQFISLLPDSSYYFTFQNVNVNGANNIIFTDNTYDNVVNSNWAGLKNAYLMSNSYGNTLEIMNY